MHTRADPSQTVPVSHELKSRCNESHVQAVSTDAFRTSWCSSGCSLLKAYCAANTALVEATR
eukprot:6353486-Lingulodinium_polyedra.AAC.1